MNQSQLGALFQEPVGAGMAVADLDRLLEMVQATFQNSISKDDSDNFLKVDYLDKIATIMKSIYHFDQLKIFNSQKYNANKLQLLIVYLQIALKQFNTHAHPADGVLIFVLGVHLGIKYHQTQQKQIANTLELIFQIFQDQTSLFDGLLAQMYQQLVTIQSFQQITPVLFILNHLLHFLFQIRTIDEQLQTLVDITLKCLVNTNFQEGGSNFSQQMSEIIILIVQKYRQYSPNKLVELINNNDIMRFFLAVVVLDEITMINVLKTLCILVEFQLQQEFDLYLTTPPVMAQLIQEILPTIVQLLSQPNITFNAKILCLQFIQTNIKFPYLYTYYYRNAKLLFLYVILKELIFDDNDEMNLHDNPVEFYELISSISRKDDDTYKGQAAQMLQNLCRVIDGFARFAFDLAIEIQLFSLQVNTTTPITDEACAQYPNSEFFNTNEEDRNAVLILVIILMKDTIIVRKDLRHCLEVFLKTNLKLMKKQVNPICKCLLLQTLQHYLPTLFPSSENSFKVCSKFVFQLLNKAGQKKCVKIFAIECLKALLADEQVSYRMEAAICQHIQQFCNQTASSEIEIFYDLVLEVLKSCNQIVDQHMDRVMSAIKDRIKLACTKDIQNLKKVNHASIVFSCINILDNILSMSYCLNHSAQIEPHLLEINKMLLANEHFDFLDEILDADAKYIAFTRGLSELTYMIFDNLPLFMEKYTKFTISTVFKLYLYATIYASEVMKSKPQWISVMLKFVYSQLTTNQSSEDLIKICILFETFYQYYNLSEVYLQLTQQFSLLLSQQLASRDIMPQLFICIMMPCLTDPSKLDIPEMKAIIVQTSAYLNISFDRPQTVTNFKYLLMICSLLIQYSAKLFDQANLNPIVEQLFQQFLNKFASYIDKVTFESKIGEPELEQKIAKQSDLFDMDINENALDKHLKQMNIYKLESKIDKEYTIDLQMLPLQQQTEMQLYTQVIQFLQVNYNGLLMNLNMADRKLLQSITQIEHVDVDLEQPQIRQVFNVEGARRKQKQHTGNFKCM